MKETQPLLVMSLVGLTAARRQNSLGSRVRRGPSSAVQSRVEQEMAVVRLSTDVYRAACCPRQLFAGLNKPHKAPSTDWHLLSDQYVLCGSYYCSCDG